MPFTEQQNKALSAKLNAKHVRTRDKGGKRLSYIEGWHVIAEANRIFGFDGWDRQTVATQCVWKGTKQGREGCAYIVRVRIRVRVGDTVICREGHGSGHGWRTEIKPLMAPGFIAIRTTTCRYWNWSVIRWR